MNIIKNIENENEMIIIENLEMNIENKMIINNEKDQQITEVEVMENQKEKNEIKKAYIKKFEIYLKEVGLKNKCNSNLVNFTSFLIKL